MTRTIEDPQAISTFYHLRGGVPPGRPCRGLACFAGRGDAPARWQQACAPGPAVHCLGLCHAAPAAAGDEPPTPVRLAAPTAVLLSNILDGGVRELGEYLARGGGAALAAARALRPDALVELVTQSGLRGRGGAAYRAGRKWSSVREAGGQPIIVVNADEGDPGAFSDKALLEGDPFLLLEAVGIAAHAVGASAAIIYLRCEYPAAARVLDDALHQAAEARWLVEPEIRLVTGEGGFICGEETSLLNALEGRRPFARHRPPYPAEEGLHGRATLVHNVETLCALPWIVAHGAEAYRALGRGESAGTKLVSLNSLFRSPGLIEAPFGIPVRRIVEEIGGGLRRGRLMGVMIGGPLAGLVPPGLLDVEFTHEALGAIGCAVGHGGVIGFADDTSVGALIAEVFRFGASESCGLCVPCRLGTADLARAFHEVVGGRTGITRERWDALVAALEQTSLCGHGTGLAEFARSIERHYPEALAACLQ